MNDLTRFAVAVLLCSTSAVAKETLVHNVAEFDAAVKEAQPGDEIVLADGEWRDAELKFSTHGDPKQYSLLRAETPGQVVLTGKSSLRIGGKYLTVRDLLWKDCSAESEIVAFRIDSKTQAHYCNLHACAILGDSPGEERKWVSLYGDNNSVGNCRFEGKRSGGTLLVVWLPESDHDGTVSLRPDHYITDNFFGPRSKLGKNGGEIIRVGDSKTSEQDAGVSVDYNYFYRCDGEAEIISNKSSGNRYEHNIFIGCSGALTLRHGNFCQVHHNAFFGDDQKGTGGVRVIGEGHRVTANLFHALTGDDARAALSLMNGIPDSPLNGYFRVKDATIENNTFIECKESIVVGLRDDDQKKQSLPPLDCKLTNNAVISPKRPVFFVRAEPVNLKCKGNVFVGKELGLEDGEGWRQAPPVQFDITRRMVPHSDGSEFTIQSFDLLLEPSDVGPAWMRPGDGYLPEVLKKR